MRRSVLYCHFLLLLAIATSLVPSTFAGKCNTHSSLKRLRECSAPYGGIDLDRVVRRCMAPVVAPTAPLPISPLPVPPLPSGGSLPRTRACEAAPFPVAEEPILDASPPPPLPVPSTAAGAPPGPPAAVEAGGPLVASPMAALAVAGGVTGAVGGRQRRRRHRGGGCGPPAGPSLQAPHPSTSALVPSVSGPVPLLPPSSGRPTRAPLPQRGTPAPSGPSGSLVDAASLAAAVAVALVETQLAGMLVSVQGQRDAAALSARLQDCVSAGAGVGGGSGGRSRGRGGGRSSCNPGTLPSGSGAPPPPPPSSCRSRGWAGRALLCPHFNRPLALHRGDRPNTRSAA